MFLLVNLFALLQYRHLMSRTLLASTNHHEEEFMMGSYHGKLKIGSTIKTSQIESTNRLMVIDTNRTSSIRLQRYQSDHLVHSPSVPTPTIDTTNNTGKFAYIFLLGGAMSTKAGTDYRGGLYGAVTAAHSLRRQGSKADVIIMVQISATTNATKLPDLEEALLRAMNIHIKYLPKYSDSKLESFYSLMMEKFRILQMEEYSRVLYLDADMLPLCNLDYLMELSESGEILQENVVLAYKGEPASGGIFVMKPNISDYNDLIDHITKTESDYLENEYPHWDPIKVRQIQLILRYSP